MTSRCSKLFACALLALGSGCKTVTYSTGLPLGKVEQKRTAPFYFFGLAGLAIVDLDEACPQGVARWQNSKAPDDTFLSIVTLGIYTPRTVRIWCAAPAEARHD